MNVLRMIRPYRFNGGWAFDDERVGLVREPFVAGVPEMIDQFLQQVPGVRDEFLLTFSDAPFPGEMVALDWAREELGGNWYRWRQTGGQGWLCPALFKYFDTAPQSLHLRIDPVPERADAITVPRADAELLLQMLEAGDIQSATQAVRSALAR